MRLTDALAFSDEGKDVRVVGVIASLPAQLERGQRFEFEVEQVQGEVHVPRRLSLAWYGADARVRPAELWEFTVRLRRAQATQVQLAVTIALVPLTVLLFQQVSFVSPLANAVAIPLVSLVVTPLALLGGFLLVLPEPLALLAGPALAIAHWLFALLAQALGWVGGFGWASVALPAPPWWTLPLALAGVAWLLAPPGWPARWVGALWLLPMLLVQRTDAGGALQWRLRIDGRDAFAAWRQQGRRYWHNQPAAAGLAQVNDAGAGDAGRTAPGYDAAGERGPSPVTGREAALVPPDVQNEAQADLAPERQPELQPGVD